MNNISLSQPALYEQVAERLRNRIYAHELVPGTWVDEQKLAEEYGISRTPMREALKVLASEGLVQLKPRRGCYVTQLSEEDLDEIFPVMALLEGRVAYEATVQATDKDMTTLQNIHDRLEKSAKQSNIDKFFEANQDFHQALQQLAGNRWLQKAIDDLRIVVRLTRRDSLRLDGRVTQSLEEHRAILAAIQKRDATEAGRLMHDHLLSGRMALAKLHTKQ
ncbi:MAG: GntR family transcriptional regulator [Burkholderiaceae bacterium]